MRITINKVADVGIRFSCVLLIVAFALLIWVCISFGQDPPFPQQMLVIRETNLVTNVTVTVHTTVYEVRGIRIEGQWIAIPRGTSVMFRFESNVWSNLP